MLELILSLFLAADIGTGTMPSPYPAPPKMPPVRVEPSKPVKKLTGPLHSHRCSWCGTVWVHSDASFGKIEDHRCPNCGRVEWRVYQRNVQAVPQKAAPANPVSWQACPT